MKVPPVLGEIGIHDELMANWSQFWLARPPQTPQVNASILRECPDCKGRLTCMVLAEVPRLILLCTPCGLLAASFTLERGEGWPSGARSDDTKSAGGSSEPEGGR